MNVPRKIDPRRREEKKNIIRRNHDDSQTEYPEFKETLQKVADIAFWNIMKKDIFKHMQEYPICQLKGKSRKQELEEEVERPEEIWK